MKFKRIIAAFLSSVLIALSAAGCSDKTSSGTENTENIVSMREISTTDIVKEMGFGINLGNTLEACGTWISSSALSNYETAWGSPIVTQELINGYAAGGFGVLRIPVAWSNLMSNDGTYTISPELMARVTQIVNWALEAKMYVIVNLHYDSGWLKELPDKKEEYMAKYTAIWEQVSANFKDYGDYLMLESQNEELGWDTVWNRWGGTEGKEDAYALANEVNQKFVDIVRNSGGNNDKRHLLISGYCTDVDLTCDPLFKMPTDPANRMAVSVHYYTPSTLTILEKDASWGKARTQWGNEADLAELDKYAQMLKTTFIDKDIPVIVGEYGCFGKNKSREVITNYLKTVSKAMYEVGACPVLWDTVDNEYNRYSFTFRDPEFIKELLSPLEAGEEQE